MESNYTSFSSSSSSRETKNFNASLHGVRKPSAKPWNNKKPIAQLQPKVYQVEPMNFRDLVQKLTGRPDHQAQQRLQRVAPPALNMAEAQRYMTGRDLSAPKPALELFTSPKERIVSESSAGGMISFGIDLLLSPSSYNWCAFPLLSPGTLCSFEQSTVP